jgi:hypothetical protein
MTIWTHLIWFRAINFGFELLSMKTSQLHIVVLCGLVGAYEVEDHFNLEEGTMYSSKTLVPTYLTTQCLIIIDHSMSFNWHENLGSHHVIIYNHISASHWLMRVKSICLFQKTLAANRIYSLQMFLGNRWCYKWKTKSSAQNYWVFGHFQSSSILENRKNEISETGSVSILRWGEDTYSVGPLRKS